MWQFGLRNKALLRHWTEYSKSLPPSFSIFQESQGNNDCLTEKCAQLRNLLNEIQQKREAGVNVTEELDSQVDRFFTHCCVVCKDISAILQQKSHVGSVGESSGGNDFSIGLELAEDGLSPSNEPSIELMDPSDGSFHGMESVPVVFSKAHSIAEVTNLEALQDSIITVMGIIVDDSRGRAVIMLSMEDTVVGTTVFRCLLRSISTFSPQRASILINLLRILRCLLGSQTLVSQLVSIEGIETLSAIISVSRSSGSINTRLVVNLVRTLAFVLWNARFLLAPTGSVSTHVIPGSSLNTSFPGIGSGIHSSTANPSSFSVSGSGGVAAITATALSAFNATSNANQSLNRAISCDSLEESATLTTVSAAAIAVPGPGAVVAGMSSLAGNRDSFRSRAYSTSSTGSSKLHTSFPSGNNKPSMLQRMPSGVSLHNLDLSIPQPISTTTEEASVPHQSHHQVTQGSMDKRSTFSWSMFNDLLKMTPLSGTWVAGENSQTITSNNGKYGTNGEDNQKWMVSDWYTVNLSLTVEDIDSEERRVMTILPPSLGSGGISSQNMGASRISEGHSGRSSLSIRGGTGNGGAFYDTCDSPGDRLSDDGVNGRRSTGSLSHDYGPSTSFYITGGSSTGGNGKMSDTSGFSSRQLLNGLISVIDTATEAATTPADVLDILRLLAASVVRNPSAQLAFDTAGLIDGLYAMLCTVETNLPLLASCRHISRAAANGISHQNSAILGETTESRSEFFNPVGSEFDGYYSSVQALLLRILLDDNTLPTTSYASQQATNGTVPTGNSSEWFAQTGLARHLSPLKLVCNLLRCTHPPLVTMGARIVTALLRWNPLNVVALDRCDVINALLDSTVRLVATQRCDLTILNTENVHTTSSLSGSHTANVSPRSANQPSSGVSCSDSFSHDLSTGASVDDLLAAAGSVKSYRGVYADSNTSNSLDLSVSLALLGELLSPLRVAAVSLGKRDMSISAVLCAILVGIWAPSDSTSSAAITAAMTALDDEVVACRNTDSTCALELASSLACACATMACQNCGDAAVAEVACLSSACSSVAALCHDCDTVFHKAPAKRCHIRVPAERLAAWRPLAIVRLALATREWQEHERQRHSEFDDAIDTEESDSEDEEIRREIPRDVHGSISGLSGDFLGGSNRLDGDGFCGENMVARLARTLVSEVRPQHMTSLRRALICDHHSESSKWTELVSVSLLKSLTQLANDTRCRGMSPPSFLVDVIAVLMRATLTGVEVSHSQTNTDPDSVISQALSLLATLSTPQLAATDAMESPRRETSTSSHTTITGSVSVEPAVVPARIDSIRLLGRLALSAVDSLLVAASLNESCSASDSQFSWWILRELVLSAARSNVLGLINAFIRWFPWALGGSFGVISATSVSVEGLRFLETNLGNTSAEAIKRKGVTVGGDLPNAFPVITGVMRVVILQELRLLLTGPCDGLLGSAVEERLSTLVGMCVRVPSAVPNASVDSSNTLWFSSLHTSLALKEAFVETSGIAVLLSLLVGERSPRALASFLTPIIASSQSQSTSISASVSIPVRHRHSLPPPPPPSTMRGPGHGSAGVGSASNTDYERSAWWLALGVLLEIIAGCEAAKQSLDSLGGSATLGQLLIAISGKVRDLHLDDAIEWSLSQAVLELCVSNRRIVTSEPPFLTWALGMGNIGNTNASGLVTSGTPRGSSILSEFWFRDYLSAAFSSVTTSGGSDGLAIFAPHYSTTNELIAKSYLALNPRLLRCDPLPLCVTAAFTATEVASVNGVVGSGGVSSTTSATNSVLSTNTSGSTAAGTNGFTNSNSVSSNPILWLPVRVSTLVITPSATTPPSEVDSRIRGMSDAGVSRLGPWRYPGAAGAGWTLSGGSSVGGGSNHGYNNASATGLHSQSEWEEESVGAARTIGATSRGSLSSQASLGAVVHAVRGTSSTAGSVGVSSSGTNLPSLNNITVRGEEAMGRHSLTSHRSIISAIPLTIPIAGVPPSGISSETREFPFPPMVPSLLQSSTVDNSSVPCLYSFPLFTRVSTLSNCGLSALAVVAHHALIVASGLEEWVGDSLLDDTSDFGINANTNILPSFICDSPNRVRRSGRENGPTLPPLTSAMGYRHMLHKHLSLLFPQSSTMNTIDNSNTKAKLNKETNYGSEWQGGPNVSLKWDSPTTVAAAVAGVAVRGEEAWETLLALTLCASRIPQRRMLAVLYGLLEGDARNAALVSQSPSLPTLVALLLPSLSPRLQDAIATLLVRILNYAPPPLALRRLLHVAASSGRERDKSLGTLEGDSSETIEDNALTVTTAAAQFVLGAGLEPRQPRAFVDFVGGVASPPLRLPSFPASVLFSILAAEGYSPISMFSSSTSASTSSSTSASTSASTTPSISNTGCGLSVACWIRVTAAVPGTASVLWTLRQPATGASLSCFLRTLSDGEGNIMPQLCLSLTSPAACERLSQSELGTESESNDDTAAATTNTSDSTRNINNMGVHGEASAYWTAAVHALVGLDDEEGPPSPHDTVSAAAYRRLVASASCATRAMVAVALPAAVIDAPWAVAGSGWRLVNVTIHSESVLVVVDGSITKTALRFTPFGYTADESLRRQYSRPTAGSTVGSEIWEPETAVGAGGGLLSALLPHMPPPPPPGSAPKVIAAANAAAAMAAAAATLEITIGTPPWITTDFASVGPVTETEYKGLDDTTVVDDPLVTNVTRLSAAVSALVGGFHGSMSEFCVYMGTVDSATLADASRNGPTAPLAAFLPPPLVALGAADLIAAAQTMQSSFIQSSETGTEPIFIGCLSTENSSIPVCNSWARPNERAQAMDASLLALVTAGQFLNSSPGATIHAQHSALSALGGYSSLFPLLRVSPAQAVAALRIVGGLLASGGPSLVPILAHMTQAPPTRSRSRQQVWTTPSATLLTQSGASQTDGYLVLRDSGGDSALLYAIAADKSLQNVDVVAALADLSSATTARPLSIATAATVAAFSSAASTLANNTSSAATASGWRAAVFGASQPALNHNIPTLLPSNSLGANSNILANGCGIVEAAERIIRPGLLGVTIDALIVARGNWRLANWGVDWMRGLCEEALDNGPVVANYSVPLFGLLLSGWSLGDATIVSAALEDLRKTDSHLSMANQGTQQVDSYGPKRAPFENGSGSAAAVVSEVVSTGRLQLAVLRLLHVLLFGTAIEPFACDSVSSLSPAQITVIADLAVAAARSTRSPTTTNNFAIRGETEINGRAPTSGCLAAATARVALHESLATMPILTCVPVTDDTYGRLLASSLLLGNLLRAVRHGTLTYQPGGTANMTSHSGTSLNSTVSSPVVSPPSSTSCTLSSPGHAGASVAEVLRAHWPGQTLMAVALDIMATAAAEVRVNGLRLLAWSLFAPDGSVDRRALATFERTAGWAAVTAQLSRHPDSADDMVLDALFAIAFWSDPIGPPPVTHRVTPFASSNTNPNNSVGNNTINNSQVIGGASGPSGGSSSTASLKTSHTNTASGGVPELTVVGALEPIFALLRQASAEQLRRCFARIDACLTIPSTPVRNITSNHSNPVSTGVGSGGNSSVTGPSSSSTKSAARSLFTAAAELDDAPSSKDNKTGELANSTNSSLTSGSANVGTASDLTVASAIVARNFESLLSMRDWLLRLADLILTHRRRLASASISTLGTNVPEDGESLSAGGGSAIRNSGLWGGGTEGGSESAAESSIGDVFRRRDSVFSAGDGSDCDSSAGGTVWPSGGGGGNVWPGNNGWHSAGGFAANNEDSSGGGRSRAVNRQRAAVAVTAPVFLLIDRLLAADALAKPGSSRRWHDVLRLSLPESSQLQEEVLLTRLRAAASAYGPGSATVGLSSTDESTTGGASLAPLQNLCDLLSAATSSARLSAAFCVAALSSLASLVEAVAPEWRARLSTETALTAVRLALVLRCVVDVGADVHRRTATLADVRIALQAAIVANDGSSSGGKAVTDSQFAVLLLGMFCEAHDEVVGLLGSAPSTGNTASGEWATELGSSGYGCGTGASGNNFATLSTGMTIGSCTAGVTTIGGDSTSVGADWEPHVAWPTSHHSVDAVSDAGSDCLSDTAAQMYNHSNVSGTHNGVIAGVDRSVFTMGLLLSLLADLAAWSPEARKYLSRLLDGLSSDPLCYTARLLLHQWKDMLPRRVSQAAEVAHEYSDFDSAMRAVTSQSSTAGWWGGWGATTPTPPPAAAQNSSVIDSATVDTIDVTEAFSSIAPNPLASDIFLEHSNTTTNPITAHGGTEIPHNSRDVAIAPDFFLTWYFSDAQRDFHAELRTRIARDLRSSLRHAEKLREKSAQHLLRHTKSLQDKTAREKAATTKAVTELLATATSAGDRTADAAKRELVDYVNGLRDRLVAGHAAIHLTPTSTTESMQNGCREEDALENFRLPSALVDYLRDEENSTTTLSHVEAFNAAKQCLASGRFIAQAK